MQEPDSEQILQARKALAGKEGCHGAIEQAGGGRRVSEGWTLKDKGCQSGNGTGEDGRDGKKYYKHEILGTERVRLLQEHKLLEEVLRGPSVGSLEMRR